MGIDFAKFPLGERESDHVCGTITTEIGPVYLTNALIIDEQQADFFVRAIQDLRELTQNPPQPPGVHFCLVLSVFYIDIHKLPFFARSDLERSVRGIQSDDGRFR